MDKYGVGLHAHLGTRRTGEIERLDRLDALRSGMVFAHAINFTQREVELIKLHDVKLDHNPGASMHGAYGASIRGRFPELLEMGICVALGCDAAANNNTLDMFREMRLVATLHKEIRGRSDVIPAATAFAMATENGARACGWSDVGRLEVGARADVIALDASAAHIAPNSNPLSSVVYAASGSDVRLTVVDGTVLMRDRQITGMDESAIITAAIESAEAVRRRWKGRVGEPSKS
jgi:5-methylthioadenosine/S-adenosylhomocysteine deaminase